MISRIVDATIAGLLLLALSPLLLLVALLISLDSPGSPLFSHIRVGKDLSRFRLLKFRTMQVRDPDGIDQVAETVVSGADDSRITRLGRLLRRTSIDELPQLINILCGHMTFVGPRPIIPEQLEAIPSELMTRFKVAPGLTGLAQVKGRRSLDWMDQLRIDAYYVDNHSFWLDFAIVLRTVTVVFSGRGVYDPNAKNWRAYRGVAHRDRVDD